MVVYQLMGHRSLCGEMPSLPYSGETEAGDWIILWPSKAWHFQLAEIDVATELTRASWGTC